MTPSTKRTVVTTSHGQAPPPFCVPDSQPSPEASLEDFPYVINQHTLTARLSDFQREFDLVRQRLDRLERLVKGSEPKAAVYDGDLSLMKSLTI
jgi:hypothetical protein